MNKEDLADEIELLCEQLGLALELGDADLIDLLFEKLENAMYQLKETK